MRAGKGRNAVRWVMPQIVEISLRLPSLRWRVTESSEETLVDNKDVRFTKRVELPAIPKPGDMVAMTAGDGKPFPCEVTQANWHDDKNMFVVACRYGKRSVSPDDYRIIANSPDWVAKPLL